MTYLKLKNLNGKLSVAEFLYHDQNGKLVVKFANGLVVALSDSCFE